jgi:uncharacterized protein YidB (DUF937 family)
MVVAVRLSPQANGDDRQSRFLQVLGHAAVIGMAAELVGAGNDDDVGILLQRFRRGAPAEELDWIGDLAGDGINEGQVAVVVPNTVVERIELGIGIETE